MITKEAIKTRICINSTEPTYPLGMFVEWIERECDRYTLELLKQVEDELYVDEQAWQQAESRGNVTRQKAQASLWRLYCAQVRGYYQTIVHDRRNKKRLSFLLQDKKRKNKWTLN